MDFYDSAAEHIVARMLRDSNDQGYPDGTEVGQYRIHRLELRKQYKINDNYGLNCLENALSNLGYTLFELNYSSDFFIVNSAMMFQKIKVLSESSRDMTQEQAAASVKKYFEEKKRRNAMKEL